MPATFDLYAIYDRKAQVYFMPFTAAHEAEALRTFAQMVVQSETPLSQYPADFDLLRLGTIGTETGILTPENPTPYPIINGLVSLTTAQRERSRYQSILSTVQQEEPAPEAS